jgi:aryl-alcohol dehydrogenase-like predicted oxidoreductase
MKTRSLGPFTVSCIGAGCMSLSHGYGPPPAPADAARVLNRALDLGYTLIDTAALYGFGANETLVGEAIGHRRGEYVLASKGGIFKNDAGVREIDGRPETLRRSIDASLQRLRTDVIDLYYLHRWDKKVPIEDSMGALADAVSAGKVRTLGLSEVSAGTLRRAHAVHPITAVQSEYSLWTRNPEIEILAACRELGVGFVAFSPLARQYLTGRLTDVTRLAEGDLRRAMPRFTETNYAGNLGLLPAYEALAERVGVTPAQLALAWVLAKGEDIVPIPGTTRIEHLEENAGAAEVELTAEVIAALDDLINEHTVHGPRYNARNQREVDSAEFAHHLLSE